MWIYQKTFFKPNLVYFWTSTLLFFFLLKILIFNLFKYPPFIRVVSNILQIPPFERVYSNILGAKSLARESLLFKRVTSHFQMLSFERVQHFFVYQKSVTHTSF